MVENSILSLMAVTHFNRLMTVIDFNGLEAEDCMVLELGSRCINQVVVRFSST
ncbi:hypothetical protein THII_2801 [Thioploca ingrica]|uniref:Uncharacterized protein n=1 Tax=Thioploca ingrica TaxID=40754 RepID=A0A090AG02_9GAMM|nr:hypothetical protein THII_2801 [Thioploca ingrica]